MPFICCMNEAEYKSHILTIESVTGFDVQEAYDASVVLRPGLTIRWVWIPEHRDYRFKVMAGDNELECEGWVKLRELFTFFV